MWEAEEVQGRGDIHVLVADHVDYRRNQHKDCKVVILQLKRNKFLKRLFFYLTFRCFFTVCCLRFLPSPATCSHCLHQTVNFRSSKLS